MRKCWRTMKFFLTMSGVLAGLLAAPAWATDDPPGRVGRVAEVHGQAWIQVSGEGEWTALTRNRPFTSNDRISTDRDSRLELQIGSTAVRLDMRSELLVQRLDDDRIDLLLQSGSAAARLREPEVIREFSLQTEQGSLLPRSTGLFRLDRGESDWQASALSGEFSFNTSTQTVNVRGGQRLSYHYEPGMRSPEQSISNLADDDFERWVRAEDARDMQRAARGPISPEMTGAEDLAEQGRWETHPEHGSVWTPTVVVAGWAPYRFGHWVSVAPWGWTWVDDAPWGFAPFHYGRWLFWGGRWCWAPGQYVRRPVYAPAMVGWVGGPRLSVSVSVGLGPTVGWVPLAPREVFVPAYRHSPVYVQNINVTHVHVAPGYRGVPRQGQPVMYTNQGVPGGITAVSSKVLQQRLPVAAAAQPIMAQPVGREGRSNGRTPLAPLTVAPPPMVQPVQRQSTPEPGDRLPPSRRFSPADEGRNSAPAGAQAVTPRSVYAAPANQAPGSEPQAVHPQQPAYVPHLPHPPQGREPGWQNEAQPQRSVPGGTEPAVVPINPRAHPVRPAPAEAEPSAPRHVSPAGARVLMPQAPAAERAEPRVQAPARVRAPENRREGGPGRERERD